MAFDRKVRRSIVPDDPESLYRLLAPTNSGPDSLWGHQTDLLRDWHANFRTRPDVALELPTGAGKTLVGGLVADWCRRSERTPVGYLCPNRQLAAQAAARLGEYGVPVALLTGQSRSWDRAARARFTSGDAVAVSTYSHVFNSNPALTDAGTLILDDAHSGEQPVASAWSVGITRSEAAYKAVLSVVSAGLDPLVVRSLRDDNSVRQFHRTVFLVSPVVVAENAGQLESTLNQALKSNGLDKGQSYPLGTIAGRLGRCLVYVSFRDILIRPLISPTASHMAFSDPGRRVYMSATLGAGGELERSFGRAEIARMPIPRGWDKQGTGRRFFVFPSLATELSRDDSLLAPWLSKTIARHGRAALITPSAHVSEGVLKDSMPTGYIRLDGHTVENDMTLFTGQGNAVLDLANRYDGVDLPDDACRLLVLAGLPAQGDLQERFLYDALGAGAVLQERVRARVTQGMGRATRNTKDHATVIVVGDDLTNFVIRPDVLAALREELQAEIEFGREQSLNRPIDDVDENISLFLAQGEDWREVESDIVASRDTRRHKDPPGTAEFAAAAGSEVAAVNAWWEGDLDRALAEAGKVIDALSGNPASARYSALWFYLAAAWARMAARQNGDPDGSLSGAADGFLNRARAAGRGTTWLSHLVARADEISSADAYDDLDRIAARQIAELLRTWKRNDGDELEDAKAGLAQTGARAFEAGLKSLGRLAGATESFDSGRAQAAPDSTWVFGDELWITWEAKSEADPSGIVGAKSARQATGHLRFVADKRQTEPPPGSFTCLTTPQTRVDHAAKAVCADDVYHVPASQPAELLAALERALDKARRLGPGVDTAGVLAALKGENCLPTQWVPALARHRLNRFGDD